MTTATPEQTRDDVRGLSALKEALERPLTPYYLLLGCTALLLTIGLIMVLSASSVTSYESSHNSYAVVERQVVWVCIGIPLAWVASRLPQRTLRNLSTVGLLGSMVLLALTLTPLGVTRNHQTNWLGVGQFVIQPSEFAKLAVILWAGHVYANKQRRLGELQHVLMPVVPGVGAVTLLILLQRDLGTALVLFAITLSLLWVVGAPARFFTLSASVIAVGAFWLATTSSERRQRLLSFTDPFKDYHDSGWQAAHGLLALSSGGVFGKGIGASQQKWGTLPESHTDYIFAVLGEELGLVGTLFVVGLFLAIAWSAVRVAMQTREPFVRYVSFGIMIWLLGQMIVNVGMVLSVLPVIGIPLPLVSYGGSALLPSLIALGILIGFARREPGAAAALEARKRNRPARPVKQSRGL